MRQTIAAREMQAQDPTADSLVLVSDPDQRAAILY